MNRLFFAVLVAVLMLCGAARGQTPELRAHAPSMRLIDQIRGEFLKRHTRADPVRDQLAMNWFRGGSTAPVLTSTISDVTLSNSTFLSGSAGATVGTIAVVMNFGSFAGTLSLTGTDAASFQIIGSTLVTASALTAGTYHLNIVATQSGATGSPFTLAISPVGSAAVVSLDLVSLSNSTFDSGLANATVGNISVGTTNGAFSGSLSLTGTDAASFQIVSSVLKTNGTIAAGTYSLNIVATQGGATGSPKTLAITPVGATTGTVASCGTNYYVSAAGSDSNNGTSSGTPWRSIAKVNTGPGGGFAAGNCINFRGGDNFAGCMVLSTGTNISSSSAANPIFVQSYGSGEATITSTAACPAAGNNKDGAIIIDGGGAALSGLTLQNLIVRNGSTTPDGIVIQSSGGDSSNAITVRNMDVSGFSTPNFNPFTGAEISLLGSPNVPGGCGALDNILITGNTLHGATRAANDASGVAIGGLCGAITNVTISGNHIYNMGGTQYNQAGAIGIDGQSDISLASDIIAEHNLIHDIGGNNESCGGMSGIETANARRITIRYNEVYWVRPINFSQAQDTGNGCDWDGIDLDGSTQDSIVEYNYTHENLGGGYLAFMGVGGSGAAWGPSGAPNTWRYNISENDSTINKTDAWGSLSLQNQGATNPTVYVYNNTIYQGNSASVAAHNAFNIDNFAGGGTAFGSNSIFANNLLIATAGNNLSACNSSSFANLRFKANAYYTPGGSFVMGAQGCSGGPYTSLGSWQAAVSGGDTGATTANPTLTGTFPSGTQAWTPSALTGPQPGPTAYKLQAGSPHIGTGNNLNTTYGITVGTRDYFGNTIPHGTGTGYNIGADGSSTTTAPSGTALFSDNFSGGYSANWNAGFPWEAGTNVLKPTYVQIDPAVTPSLNPFTTSPSGLQIIAGNAAGNPAAGGKSYYTGLLTSNFTRIYGYYEFVATMPNSPGSINGALWLYPTGPSGNAEIDVIEHQGNYVMQTVWDGSGTNPTQATTVSTFATALHTYAVDWQSDYITFFIDNVQTYQTVTPANSKTVPMMMVLSVNVFDPTSDGTSRPQSMTVKSVGVWTNRAARGLPAPTVTAMAVTGTGISGGSGTVGAGALVTITETFTVPVTVAGGTPSLSLNSGGAATYVSGSGTSSLTFNYTVLAGQNSSDLAVTAFNLNGATLRDASNNNANTAGAVGNPPGTLLVDTTVNTGGTCSGTQYYVALNGNDSNNGTSTATPWQTIGRVNTGPTGKFQAGQCVNFRGGDTFNGCLYLAGGVNFATGSSGNPAVVQSYGTGNATIVGTSACGFSGSGSSNDKWGVVMIDAVSAPLTGLKVQNLTIRPGSGLHGNGLVIQPMGAVVSYVTITNNDIGGHNTPNFNAYGSAEILIQNTTNVPDYGGCNTMSNITISNNTIHGLNGLLSPDANGIALDGTGYNGPTCFTSNLSITGNHVYNIGSPGYHQGAGIVLLNNYATNATVVSPSNIIVANNLIHDIAANNTGGGGGMSGVETSAINGCTIKNNEIYHVYTNNQPAGGGNDGDGIDFDGGTQSCIAEYNYTHDNQGSGLLGYVSSGNGGGGAPQGVPWRNNIYRYNISVNDNLEGNNQSFSFQLNGGDLPVTGVEVYNNTIYTSNPNSHAFGITAGTTQAMSGIIKNNIFYASGSASRTYCNSYGGTSSFSGFTMSNNGYAGNGSGTDWDSCSGYSASGTTADPSFVNPSGGTLSWTPSTTNGALPGPNGFKLNSGSSYLGAGAVISGNGGINYFGTSIPSPPSIGAH